MNQKQKCITIDSERKLTSKHTGANFDNSGFVFQIHISKPDVSIEPVLRAWLLCAKETYMNVLWIVSGFCDSLEHF